MRQLLSSAEGRQRFAFLLVLAVTLLAGCAVTPAARRGSATPTVPPQAAVAACDPATQWRPPANNAALDDLAMVAPDEGWAVGGLTGPFPPANPGEGPAGVIYHLTNGQWQRLPQTYPNAELSTISMDSPDDGWAASTSAVAGTGDRVLVLHYSGGRWQPVDVPALDAVLKGPPGTSGDVIMSLSLKMFGADAGWMFAETNIPRDLNNPASRPEVVILRYEHGAWTPIAAPAVAATTELFALSAVSADEAWIVGTDYGTNLETLFAHYDNGAWSIWPRTFPGVTEGFTMLSSTDGWAFDSDATGSGNDNLLHFDGTAWAPVALPDWADQRTTLTSAVFPISPGIT